MYDDASDAAAAVAGLLRSWHRGAAVARAEAGRHQPREASSCALRDVEDERTVYTLDESLGAMRLPLGSPAYSPPGRSQGAVCAVLRSVRLAGSDLDSWTMCVTLLSSHPLSTHLSCGCTRRSPLIRVIQDLWDPSSPAAVDSTMNVRRALVGALHVRAIAAATEGLELRQLQVVHRHGDRTPITPLADRVFWSSVLPSSAELATLAQGTEVLRAKGTAPHPAAGDGLFGTLSTRGVDQMRSGGAALREKYGHFLPPVATPEAVRVFSTDFPRTIQSVQALLQGLFPPAARRGPPVEIDTSRTAHMIPDPEPRATTEQEEREAAVLRSEAVLAHAEEVEPLRTRLSQALLDARVVDPAAYQRSWGVGDQARGATLSWNKLAEVLKCLHSYSRLPPGVTADDVRRANEAGAYRWTVLMRDRRIAQLAMGSLTAAIVKAASGVARGTPGSPVLVVWSGHDSTLFGLLAALELEAPSEWPPYASQLHVELLEEVLGSARRPRGSWHLRFTLNGEVLRCALGGEAAGEPASIVPLERVRRGLRRAHGAA